MIISANIGKVPTLIQQFASALLHDQSWNHPAGQSAAHNSNCGYSELGQLVSLWNCLLPTV